MNDVQGMHTAQGNEQIPHVITHFRYGHGFHIVLNEEPTTCEVRQQQIIESSINLRQRAEHNQELIILQEIYCIKLMI